MAEMLFGPVYEISPLESSGIGKLLETNTRMPALKRYGTRWCLGVADDWSSDAGRDTAAMAHRFLYVCPSSPMLEWSL